MQEADEARNASLAEAAALAAEVQLAQQSSQQPSTVASPTAPTPASDPSASQSAPTMEAERLTTLKALLEAAMAGTGPFYPQQMQRPGSLEAGEAKPPIRVFVYNRAWICFPFDALSKKLNYRI